ncbi:hypothetical protein BC938DRAFT_474445 [Jimgerdemannia flammicorona]|uniref:Uncharacterized protein n=1 Tax=Jimgerdemannia flammicorona TaxID=994334 RepID=A0A433Q293_9FUNG|nr:hypothetical protein BC938DRAFT_474445 [Jimgerdemannia flammicorona]
MTSFTLPKREKIHAGMENIRNFCAIRGFRDTSNSDPENNLMLNIYAIKTVLPILCNQTIYKQRWDGI